LPTEAEWERAARSGEAGWRFPWGSTISFSNANYQGTTAYTYDLSGTNGYHPAYYDPFDPPYTSPVGSFPSSAYGLYDMVGNVWEWCWDCFDTAWYGNPAATQKDTPGSAGPATNRVMRGGSWESTASAGRCANRMGPVQFQSPESADFTIGFRCVRALPGFLPPATLDDAAALPSGQFRFTLYNLTPGKTNIIEASGNLTVWSGVATNVPSMATMNFTNTPGPGVQAHFYRSRQLP
jgi:hypothetical protein